MSAQHQRPTNTAAATDISRLHEQKNNNKKTFVAHARTIGHLIYVVWRVCCRCDRSEQSGSKAAATAD